MMISGKSEGREAIMLTILMIQTLFMITGVEATTVISSSLVTPTVTIVAASPAVTTQSSLGYPSSPATVSSSVKSSRSVTAATTIVTDSPSVATQSSLGYPSSPATLSSSVKSSSPVTTAATTVADSLAVTIQSSSPSTSSPATLSSPVKSSSLVTPTATTVADSSAVATQPSSSQSTSLPTTSSSLKTSLSPSAAPSTIVASHALDSTRVMQASSATPSAVATTAAVQPSQTSSAPLPSSSVSPTGTRLPQDKTEEVEVYIKITFKMPWGRLCFLRSLFKHALSDDLIEFKPLKHETLKLLTYEKVEPARIKLMNDEEKCQNRTFHNDEAVLQFYISNQTTFNTTDKEMTIKAFIILHGYWVNKRMILLDKVFENKVKKVQLIGVDEEQFVDEYTEAQRIGIGIGVGLGVVVLILLIYYCVRGCRNVRSVGRLPEDKRMIFTNTVALNEEATRDAGDAVKTEDAGETGSDEPQEVVIHTQPLAQASDEIPLLSAIKDYEDGRKDETDAGQAPLAKPENDNVSEGEPIKSSDEPEGQPVKPSGESEGEPEGEPTKSTDEPEAVAPPEDAPSASEPPATEKPPETEGETFTSSVTIVITPTSSPTEFEFPGTENPPEPANESDDVKPDFGQSDNVDGDTAQGAINLAFDDKDEVQADQKEKEDEEETKF